MVIKKIELERVCGITSTIPHNSRPEIAFAGRSNVGKSSLLNCLVNRKSLAKTSSSPGKTQTINYYLLNDQLYLVDLPGYGYTKAALEVKAKWGKMVEKYLHTSEMIRTIFLLVDIRHAPSPDDRDMYNWVIYQGYRPVIIATKADKIKRSQIDKHKKLIRETFGADSDLKIIPFSSLKGTGKENVYAILDEIIENENGNKDAAGITVEIRESHENQINEKQ